MTDTFRDAWLACLFAFVFGATPASQQAPASSSSRDSAGVVKHWREDARYMASEMAKREPEEYARRDGAVNAAQAGICLSRELRRRESPIAAPSVRTMIASDNEVGIWTTPLKVILSPTNTRIKATPGFRYTNLSNIPARTKNMARSPRMAKMLEL
jgi:hypothetical protein